MQQSRPGLVSFRRITASPLLSVFTNISLFTRLIFHPQHFCASSLRVCRRSSCTSKKIYWWSLAEKSSRTCQSPILAAKSSVARVISGIVCRQPGLLDVVVLPTLSTAKSSLADRSSISSPLASVSSIPLSGALALKSPAMTISPVISITASSRLLILLRKSCLSSFGVKYTLMWVTPFALIQAKPLPEPFCCTSTFLGFTTRWLQYRAHPETTSGSLIGPIAHL